MSYILSDLSFEQLEPLDWNISHVELHLIAFQQKNIRNCFVVKSKIYNEHFSDCRMCKFQVSKCAVVFMEQPINVWSHYASCTLLFKKHREVVLVAWNNWYWSPRRYQPQLALAHSCPEIIIFESFTRFLPRINSIQQKSFCWLVTKQINYLETITI
jgi:hypothetical protein